MDAALDRILSRWSGGFSEPLTYDLDADGTILIGFDKDMPRVVRSYDVRDILQGATADELARLVEDTVATDSWIDNGGNGANCRACGGKLIVLQTRRNHRQIELLLRQIRSLPQPFTPAPVFGNPL